MKSGIYGTLYLSRSDFVPVPQKDNPEVSSWVVLTDLGGSFPLRLTASGFTIFKQVFCKLFQSFLPHLGRGRPFNPGSGQF